MSEGEAPCSSQATQKLLRALDGALSTKEVLLDHLYLCEEDSRLLDVYQSVGFSPSRRDFRRTPQRDVVIQALTGEPIKLPGQAMVGEDMPVEEPWDVHRGLRMELGRTCLESGLMDPMDYSSELMDFPNSPSALPMANFWEEGPFASPRAAKFRGDSTTPRSSRGLKLLSRRVKEVVQERATSTYKDVADDLIRELDEMDISDKDKEEKNIRRRVYDALNVLIAAGVMGKSGKEVIWRGAELCYQPPSESQERMQCVVNEKRKILQRLVDQNVALRALIDRNKKKLAIDRITLPAKLVITSGRSEVVISSARGVSRVKVAAHAPSRIVDILELIPALRLGKVDCVPEEVRRLLAAPRYL